MGDKRKVPLQYSQGFGFKKVIMGFAWRSLGLLAVRSRGMAFVKKWLMARVPGRCQVCGLWCHHSLCADCWQRYTPVAPRCQRCALRLTGSIQAHAADCEWLPDGVAHCVAVVSYQYPWRGLVAQLKYGKHLAVSSLMADVASEQAHVMALIDQTDAIIALPLSNQRLQERGFNQAHEWARRLAPDKILGGVLLRLIHTPAQAGLDRAEREAQLAQLLASFQVDPLMAHQIKGKAVLLVDDVQTTGTTLHAAAMALRRAGAAEVNALVFARAELGGGL